VGYLNIGVFKMIVGVLKLVIYSIFEITVYVLLFNRTTLQVFVTYLTGAIYVHPL